MLCKLAQDECYPDTSLCQGPKKQGRLTTLNGGGLISLCFSVALTEMTELKIKDSLSLRPSRLIDCKK